MTTSRYHRQTMVPHIGTHGQQALANARVVIIGAGGLGCPVSSYLVGAGIGNITLIDHDEVSETNLHRQTLYREADIGKYKVDCAQKALQKLNSNTNIDTHACKINADTCNELLANADVVVDACDNFAVSYLLSDYCKNKHLPLVAASVMQTQGYVGVYCYNTHTNAPTACMRSVFPQPPEAGATCNSVGVTGPSVGIIGSLQAQEVLKVILKDTIQLAGKLLYCDLWDYRQTVINFADEVLADNDVSADSSTKTFVKIYGHQQVLDGSISDGRFNDTSFSKIFDNAHIIDVRTEQEVMDTPSVHVQHPRYINIPVLALDFTDNTPSQLPAKEQPIIFVCASGQRALHVADTALQHGYTKVAISF